MVDMGWAQDNSDERTALSALKRADSDISEQNEKLELEISIPETILEDENESRENSIVEVPDNAESKDTGAMGQSSLTKKILRKLSSSESYSGLDHSEDADQERQVSPSNSQRSRLSKFFGLDLSGKEPSDDVNRTKRVTNAFFGNFTTDSNKSILDDSDAMKEKFPGFKYRSNSQIPTNESNLSVIDEMDDIPPQRLTPGRYTTLKQIIGTADDSSLNISESGDLKGIKGTKTEPLTTGVSHTTASARARERCPDGLGAVIGGVLFDKLIVKRIEFTPRCLELKLLDIFPTPIKRSENGATPLNANKITPIREFISGTTISYDGHLILDGVDFSRDKHMEILIRVLDLPIEKSIEMLKDWVSKSISQSGSDIPDHWEGFISSNVLVFSQKVRELRENASDSRSTPAAVDPSTLRDSSKSTSKSIQPDAYTHIQHLDLRYCQINNRGVSLLADSLRRNEKLRTLNLTGNMISRDSTAASVGNMLNFNSTLLEVNLQETNLGNTGATLVAQALYINMVRCFLFFCLIFIDPSKIVIER